jgi:hypothetical protein
MKQNVSGNLFIQGLRTQAVGAWKIKDERGLFP